VSAVTSPNGVTMVSVLTDIYIIVHHHPNHLRR
jgi:hypothetical protein